MNVLLLTGMFPSEADWASGSFVEQQARDLRGLGLRVDVLRIEGASRMTKYAEAAWRCRQATADGEYHIVHAHYGLAGIPAWFRRDAALVLTVHGSDALVGWTQPALTRLACALANAVIAVSSVIANRVGGEVIPCGVDLRRFVPRAPANCRRRLGLPLDSTLVLFPFAPARRIKRHDLAVAAIDSLRRRIGGDVRLVVPENVPNEDMPWYYGACDAMILCSDSEGSPTSIKEALACNLPVVSRDVGDVREMLVGVAGAEIASGLADALADGLERAITRRRKWGFDGQAAASRYDGRKIAERVAAVYGRVLSGRRTAHGR